MILIVEGCDRTGKSTYIEQFWSKREGVEIKHFGPPPKLSKDPQINRWTQDEFQKLDYAQEIEQLVKFPTLNRVYDRFIHGELVFGPLYRYNKPEYVWDLEKKLLEERTARRATMGLKPDVLLLIFTASLPVVQQRFDGQFVEFDDLEKILKSYDKIAARTALPALTVDTTNTKPDQMGWMHDVIMSYAGTFGLDLAV